MQFETLTLPPVWFTHVAHIRLAWIYIRRHNCEVAAEKLCEQIMVFDKKFGSGTRFNKTVTTAFVKMIFLHQLRHPAEDFQTFLQLNPELIDSYRELFARHYSYNVFVSQAAKLQFAEPDLQKFPG